MTAIPISTGTLKLVSQKDLKYKSDQITALKSSVEEENITNVKTGTVMIFIV